MYTDGWNWKQANTEINMLKPVFKDGKLLGEQPLREIRDRLHGGKF